MPAATRARTKSAAKAPDVTGPAPDAATPVARFNTKRPDRRQVEIDGKFYDLRSLRDYGISAQRRLNRDGREFGELWNSAKDLTEDQDKRVKFLLDRIFLGDDRIDSLVDAPKATLRKLSDEDRVELVLDFIYAPLRKLLTAAAAQTQEPVEAPESPSILTS